MGVDPKAKSYDAANGPQDRTRDRARFVQQMRPADEQVGAAVAVIAELLVERHEADPRVPVAKLSLAKMQGPDWCASTNSWSESLGLSAFAPTPGGALGSLAAKLVAGEPWKKLAKRE